MRPAGFPCTIYSMDVTDGPDLTHDPLPGDGDAAAQAPRDDLDFIPDGPLFPELFGDAGGPGGPAIEPPPGDGRVDDRDESHGDGQVFHPSTARGDRRSRADRRRRRRRARLRGLAALVVLLLVFALLIYGATSLFSCSGSDDGATPSPTPKKTKDTTGQTRRRAAHPMPSSPPSCRHAATRPRSSRRPRAPRAPNGYGRRRCIPNSCISAPSPCTASACWPRWP